MTNTILWGLRWLCLARAMYMHMHGGQFRLLFKNHNDEKCWSSTVLLWPEETFICSTTIFFTSFLLARWKSYPLQRWRSAAGRPHTHWGRILPEDAFKNMVWRFFWKVLKFKTLCFPEKKQDQRNLWSLARSKNLKIQSFDLSDQRILESQI